MTDRDALKDAITRAGRGSVLTLSGADDWVDRWRAGLDEFVAYYAERFNEKINPFAWWNVNPHKARAFFDPDTLSLSAPMKAAVWRILIGLDIHKIELAYQAAAPSRLRVELVAAGSTDVEVYESTATEDAKLLRHLGAIRVYGEFQFQGYHAFAAPAA